MTLVDGSVSKVGLFVVSTDQATLQLVHEATVRMGMREVRCVSVEQARSQAQAFPSSVIITEFELLPVQHQPHDPTAYVIALAGVGNQGQHQFLSAVEFGVDDVVPRPFDLQTLLLRIRLGLRTLALGASSLRAVLRIALGSERNGEVVVRTAAGTSRLYLVNGSISWIHSTDKQISLREVLEGAGISGELDADDLRALIEEARNTKQHFSEVIAAWGLVPEDVVRESLRKSLMQRLDTLLSDDESHAIFLPAATQSHTSKVKFTADQLSHPSLIPPPVSGASANKPKTSRDMLPALGNLPEAVRSLKTVPGILGCAAFDLITGACLMQLGELVNVDIAWSLGAVLSEIRDDNADVLASTSDVIFAARKLESQPRFFVFVASDVHRMPVGMLRIKLREILKPSLQK